MHNDYGTGFTTWFFVYYPHCYNNGAIGFNVTQPTTNAESIASTWVNTISIMSIYMEMLESVNALRLRLIMTVSLRMVMLHGQVTRT